MKREREERPVTTQGNRLHKWWTLRDLRLILIITRSCSSTHRSPPLRFVFTRGFYLLPGLLTGKRRMMRIEDTAWGWTSGPSDHEDIYQVTAAVILYDPSATFTRFSTENPPSNVWSRVFKGPWFSSEFHLVAWYKIRIWDFDWIDFFIFVSSGWRPTISLVG